MVLNGQSQKERSFENRLTDISRALTFAEVANGLNLEGSEREGFECPACGSLSTLQVRKDNEGGRCTISECGQGYSRLTLVQIVRGCRHFEAMDWLERFAAEKAHGKADFDLFREESEA